MRPSCGQVHRLSAQRHGLDLRRGLLEICAIRVARTELPVAPCPPALDRPTLEQCAGDRVADDDLGAAGETPRAAPHAFYGSLATMQIKYP